MHRCPGASITRALATRRLQAPPMVAPAPATARVARGRQSDHGTSYRNSDESSRVNLPRLTRISIELLLRHAVNDSSCRTRELGALQFLQRAHRLLCPVDEIGKGSSAVRDFTNGS
ncbi:unnamed protein product [Trichogramma brassicae]|uniref:Uncharacterized protein n=1 Tax=Trichogramma brassicae TaxID=86971 RepID=A0A6H5IY31_9HYME|nr:unnamed protein product [Trichogramma brassicae]